MKKMIRRINESMTPIHFYIAENEIGFLFKNKQFIDVLFTGKHRFSRFFNHEYGLKKIHLEYNEGFCKDRDVLFLVQKYPQKFADLLDRVRTGENEVALLRRHGILLDILPPASEAFLWKSPEEAQVEIIHVEDTSAVSPSLYQQIKQCSSLFSRLFDIGLLHVSIVPEQYLGMQYTNDQFAKSLPPGEYAWWMFGSKIIVEKLDLRLQNMEISGQEILTKDRVSIRLNLLATWQIVDAEKLVLNVKNYNDFLYREMQLALRTVVATKTLDELLCDKNLLNEEIKNIVLPIAESKGIKVESVGVKDIILPGEMKEILSKVVEAQKLAEANSIKLREETQSTRSLHNTAKVMENNPMLLRLKELETLEKITGQIHQLNIYGGLDELMNKLVKLRDVITPQEHPQGKDKQSD